MQLTNGIAKTPFLIEDILFRSSNVDHQSIADKKVLLEENISQTAVSQRQINGSQRNVVNIVSKRLETAGGNGNNNGRGAAQVFANIKQNSGPPPQVSILYYILNMFISKSLSLW